MCDFTIIDKTAPDESIYFKEHRYSSGIPHTPLIHGALVRCPNPGVHSIPGGLYLCEEHFRFWQSASMPIQAEFGPQLREIALWKKSKPKPSPRKSPRLCPHCGKPL